MNEEDYTNEIPDSQKEAFEECSKLAYLIREEILKFNVKEPSASYIELLEKATRLMSFIETSVMLPFLKMAFKSEYYTNEMVQKYISELFQAKQEEVIRILKDRIKEETNGK